MRGLGRLLGGERGSAPQLPAPPPFSPEEFQAGVETLGEHGIVVTGADQLISRALLFESLEKGEGIEIKFSDLKAEVYNSDGSWGIGMTGSSLPLGRASEVLAEHLPSWNTAHYGIDGFRRAVRIAKEQVAALDPEELKGVEAVSAIEAHGGSFKILRKFGEEYRKDYIAVFPLSGLRCGPSPTSLLMLTNWVSGTGARKGSADQPWQVLQLAVGDQTYRIDTPARLAEVAERVNAMARMGEAVPGGPPGT